MKFNWDDFTEIDFADYCAKMENGMCYVDDYIGCVRIGNLCFDLIFRSENEEEHLSYDLYVGGVDTGYGYSNPNKWNKELYKEEDDYPYDYANGSSFEDTCIAMTYDDFQAYAEAEFKHFIEVEDEEYKEASLIDKANEPLKVW